MVDAPIYLDCHSTTPCDPRVADALIPYLTRDFGNAASRTHAFGWKASEAVESAREQLAALIGADPREIVFTSGATESNNLALRGAALALRERGDHIVSCVTEHRAVLDPLAELVREGFRVTRLPVRSDGLLDLAELEAALEPRTVLISIMHANNEIGVLQDLAAIGRLARARDIVLHSDAAQSVGKVPVDVRQLGVDLLAFTAHKLYGPKGVGALYVRRRRPPLRLVPLLHGGGHEGGLRSGTLPVALCVGFGEACRIAGAELADEAARVAALRDALLARLQSALEGVELNGHAEQRLPGNLNVSFAGVEAEALLLATPEVALSTGSACTSSKPEPSHVLRALGLDAMRALASVRFGVGRFTTAAEIDAAAQALARQVQRLRELSPAWERRRRRGH